MLVPHYELTIERGLELMRGDEYLEITPISVRLRKKFLTTTTGLGSGTISEPESAAIDGSGNIWVATQTAINGYPYFDEGVTELIGMATPAVTPITPGNIGRP